MHSKRDAGLLRRHDVAMDVSSKEGPQRSRRARSVPPPDAVETAALATRAFEEEVPRFLGVAAPLSVLSAELRQARSDHDSERVAALSVRLSRQLLRRGIELREAIGFLEKAFEIAPDPTIAQELGESWAGVGDYVRGASYLVQAAEGQPAKERARLLRQTAVYYAHAGKVPQALQALKQAMALNPLDPAPYETLGAMGFWADFPAADASRAYLEAARLHVQAGQDSAALEALLRAFEIDPAERVVADALASALRDRKRVGAADEIIREHLRRGSAAARAAHYERTFHSVLAAQKWPSALEAALEAELDVELDLGLLDAALDEVEREKAGGSAARPDTAPTARARSFEALLVNLARYGWPGPDAAKSASRFAEWLDVLVALHVCNWGLDEVLRVEGRLAGLLEVTPLAAGLSADGLHELRARLTRAETPTQEVGVRSQIALLEGSRGNWHEAYEVLEPILLGSLGSRDFRALGIALLAAGRARQTAGRARALGQLARFLPDEAAAVVSAIAAETLLSEGVVVAAADAARYAVEADPVSSRAVAAQALVALTHPERATPGQVESSLSVLVARGAACHLLAESAAQADAPHLALSWADRQVALRPADPVAVREVLERAARAGDAARLVERIEQLLAQPLPMVEVGSDVAQALRRLLELSHDEAERAARLVLSRAGIRSLDCREALAEVAEVADRPRLAADLCERLLVLAPSAERPEMLLALADHRARAGDTVAAVRALRRALSGGAARDRVKLALERLTGPLEPDAELSKLEAELELMPDAVASAAGDAEPPLDKARLLRRLGVMRFDLAQDTQGAIAAWMRAADLDPELGLERIAYYLTAVAGADEAPVLLQKAAQYTDDPLRKARLLGLAARGMLEVRRPADALQLAIEALDKAPLQTEILTVAERAAAEGDVGRLNELYGRVAEAALGRYGERAIHYRAARLLEKRGQPDLALWHAGLAFAAVPAEGAAFVLMARLSDISSDPTPAIQAIERVAEATKSEAERARWLDKAASLASMAAGGSRQRVEILLRAAYLRAEPATIGQLEAALLDLEVLDKSEQKALERRVQTLGNEAVLNAVGPQGATLCIALARLFLRVFDDLESGAACLMRAVSADIEVPDYEKVCEFAARLSERTGLLEHLEGLLRSAKRDGGQLVGRGLAELLSALASAQGNARVAAEVLTLAAADAPEDLELVGLARRAAQAAGRADLLATIGELLPPEDRARLLLSRIADLPPDEALASLLDLDLAPLGPELELAVLLELGARLLAAHRHADALDVFRQCAELSPEDFAALRGLESAAERTGDQDELARVIKLRADLEQDPAERRLLQLRRARILDRELARIGEARALLESLLASGEDTEVLDLLAQSLDASGDAERAAELWLRARAATSDVAKGDEFARRAARAYGEAGLDRAALELLSPLELDPDLCRLLLSLARRAGDRKTELRALTVLAPFEHPETRDETFLSAARIALELGDTTQAEELSRKAADGDSDEAAAARILTWQLWLTRAPTLERPAAERLLAELGPMRGVAGASQREIRAYLLAMATLVVRGDADARLLLSAALEEQGQRPLLSAALADILVKDEGASLTDRQQALGLYEAAIGGDLHGLRREGDLLLAAARVARLLGDAARARGFASAIGDDDPCRADSTRMLEDMAAEEARLLRLERERRQAEEEQERERQATLELEAREAAAREQAEAEARARAEEEAARARAEQAAQAEEAARAALLQAARDAEEAARALAEQAAREAEAEAARARAEALAQAAREAEEAARVRAEEAARALAEQAAREAEEAARAQTERLAQAAPAALASERQPGELQTRIARELEEADARARRREENAQKRQFERDKKADQLLGKDLGSDAAEAARQEARRADDEARRSLRGGVATESLGPPPTSLPATVPATDLDAALASAPASTTLSSASLPKVETPEDRERLRVAREEALRLAREEAARERSLAPAADQKRASTVPPPRRSTRPPGARSLAPMTRRTSERPLAPAPAPTAELDFPADETSVVQVTLGELREVDELTPAEEAVAAHPADWEAESGPLAVTPEGGRGAEEELVSRLEAGDVDAGVELLDRLQADRSRARDAVAVAGHLVLLRPGDGSLLGRLVASASRDGNEALALAVRHVLGSFGAGDRVAPPPLDRVRELPERTQAVLFRGLRSAGGEALTLAWEHASALFRRDPAAYGITGGDRVPPTAPTPLAELYRDTARVLGMIRTPLFRVGTGDDISMRVLLLSPPAVLVSGRVDRGTTEFAFHFGAALGAAMPEHALLYGLDPEALTNLFAALSLSFGGDARAPAGGRQPEAVRLASLLWEAIPPRVQRRLSGLCTQKDQLSSDVCLGYSTLVLRRTGLLVSGDIRIAVIDACESAGIAPPRSLAELAQAARVAPSVADLLQLAVSPEYAELRFRTGRSG